MCDADLQVTCVSQVRLQSQPKSLGMADIKGGIILIIAAINLILIIKIIISQFNDSYHHNH